MMKFLPPLSTRAVRGPCLASLLLALCLAGGGAATAPSAWAADAGAHSVRTVVWFDEDGDGLKGATEGRANNMVSSVTLTETATNTLVATADLTTSSTPDRVDFSGLKADTTYTLTYVVGPRFQFTHQLVGQAGQSSAVDPATATATFTTTAGLLRDSVLVGVTERRDRIAGRLFYDVNRNNLYDTGETPRSGLPVTLDPDAAGSTTVTTAADGTYAFTGLASLSTHTLAFPNTPTDHLVEASVGSDPTVNSAPDPDSARAKVTLPAQTPNANRFNTVTANAGYANINIQTRLSVSIPHTSAENQHFYHDIYSYRHGRVVISN